MWGYSSSTLAGLLYTSMRHKRTFAQEGPAFNQTAEWRAQGYKILVFESRPFVGRTPRILAKRVVEPSPGLIDSRDFFGYFFHLGKK